MLTTRNGKFFLDDQPFQILSGSVHYFRVVPEYWEDRLLKLKALGLNTVETYIPWNVHEPKKGTFHFSGMADVERFIALAQNHGLYVILRPSPYICAEWEMGGLPAWLLKEKDIVLRSSHPAYLKHVEDYYQILLPKFKKYLYQHGGSIIAMQIENEYGAYGNDGDYLNFLRAQYEKHGLETFLFTSDGPAFMEQGSLPDVTTTVNFGSKVDEAFARLEQFKPHSPKMVAEFWIGWFDHWHGEHHTRSAADVARVFRQLMQKGSSVNFYMFHGGTNFGFMNGANHYERYAPTITSYDYDALLTESGEITEKYEVVRQVLRDFVDVPDDLAIERTSPQTYGEIALRESVSLFDTLPDISEKVESVAPLSMEDIGQSYGFTLYRTTINRSGPLTFHADAIHDRARIYMNGRYVTTTDKNDAHQHVTLNFPAGSNTLEILVENMGRVNYGEHLSDKKGITKNIWLGEQYWFGWEIYPIELEILPKNYSGTDQRFPRFYRGHFHVDELADTYVDTARFTKGNVFINGFNLGRYWNTAGPQKRLYLPGPLLKKGRNELVVFELEASSTQTVQLVSESRLE